ncbi:S1 RNA-binding domain-containing protein (plasmid) [Vallitalea pronyensis]|uniref:S1 RNA-binding domain-containing protein n=1 Tax=Vallitalea pronyensis TaxID=1348613 RepID=A0A8J8MPS6_9FIRM|nr:S1 RNA-binding domain-containing protein [Vallitalea pronyensis]QUI25877.1 S1 RNA-binding domain-containing protein [Vallitalea pronyensis]
MNTATLNELKKKKIFTSTVLGKENMDGQYHAFLRYKDIKVLIPESEMEVEKSHLRDRIGSLIGANIEYIITKITDNHVLASRKKAMEIRRTQLQKVNAGDVIDAKIIGTATKKCIVECYGHEITIPIQDISYNWISNVEDNFHVGMNVKVKVLSKSPFTINLKDAEVIDFNPNDYAIGNEYLATVIDTKSQGVYVELDKRRSVLCRSVDWRRGCHKGDIVVIEITNVDEQVCRTWGIIKRLIKKAT